jgi:hypothetical protein
LIDPAKLAAARQALPKQIRMTAGVCLKNIQNQ